MWNYAIPLLTALLALLQLVKDWGAHKATWRRALVLLLIVGLGIGGMVNAYKNGKKVDEQAQRAEEQASTIKALTAAVETANASQVQNTKVFTDSIEHFSTKLTKLETGIQTADLRDEADHLRAELTKTQKALVTPQAVLTPGIDDRQQPDNPQFSTYVIAQKGQPFSFNVSIWNHSGVSARAGSLIVRICSVCKFHSEPPGFTHIQGQPDYERTMQFGLLAPSTRFETIPLEIDAPDDMQRFTVAFRSVCEPCTEAMEWRSATVIITRLGMHHTPVPQPK
jgi:hypothetical protein